MLRFVGLLCLQSAIIFIISDMIDEIDEIDKSVQLVIINISWNNANLFIHHGG